MKKLTIPFIQDTEISNAADIYDIRFQFSQQQDMRHMHRSTAAAVQHGDPLGKLVLLVSQRS